MLGEEGQEMPDGEVGTLWIEGDTAALCYWNEHEKTKQTLHGDAVNTGDLFVRDHEGFFWYRGRSDELIKVGGIWVAPAEVEDSLVSHPDVVECAVIGYEEGSLTLTRAYVVVRPGVTASDELAAELQAHVKTHLSPHKYPRDVRFAAQLPKTPSGKIDRRALRDDVEVAA